MKKPIVLYLAAVGGTIIGFFLLLSLYIIAEELQIDLPQGGCKDVILVPLLFGVPLGGPLAMALMDRLVYKMSSLWFVPTGVAVIFTLPGIITGVFLMDSIGPWSILAVPFLSSLTSAPVFFYTARMIRSKST